MQRRGNRGYRTGLRGIINSIKNEHNSTGATALNTNEQIILAEAFDAPTTGVTNAVQRGCIIKAISVESWIFGTGASGVNNTFDAYLIKNPGNNLTVPNPGTVGSSNEKKFVFKEWKGLLGRLQDGSPPYPLTPPGGMWFRIPKRYQRMGTNDRIELVMRSTASHNFCQKTIYKWYT